MLPAIIIYLAIIICIYTITTYGIWERALARALMVFKNTLVSSGSAQSLALQMQELLAHPNMQLQSIEMISFKFYTILIKSLVKYSRQFGAPLSRPLKELVAALRKEEQALKQMWQSFVGGLMQFLIVVMITWLFIYALKFIIDYQVTLSILYKVTLLQLLGGIFYFVGFVVSYQKVMGGFDQAFYSVYTMRSLLQAGLPLSMVLNRSQMHDFMNSATNSISNAKSFGHISKRLEYLTSHGLKQGAEILAPLNEIIDDLWVLHKNCFQHFNKLLLLIKFILLVMFFVPAYLLVSFDLVSGLMSHNL